jgi:hypothetical protein
VTRSPHGRPSTPTTLRSTTAGTASPGDCGQDGRAGEDRVEPGRGFAVRRRPQPTRGVQVILIHAPEYGGAGRRGQASLTALRALQSRAAFHAFSARQVDPFWLVGPNNPVYGPADHPTNAVGPAGAQNGWSVKLTHPGQGDRGHRGATSGSPPPRCSDRVPRSARPRRTRAAARRRFASRPPGLRTRRLAVSKFNLGHGS